MFGIYFSGKCPYAYGYSSLHTPKLNETQIAKQQIDDTFPSSNMLALVVPAGDYEKEAKLLQELDGFDEIDHSMGLSNVEAMDGYMLADKLTPRQFSEIADLDYEMACILYAAYATEQGDYGKLAGNIASYKVPLMDMFLFVCDQVDAGIVSLSEEQTRTLTDAKSQIESTKAQLQGKQIQPDAAVLNASEKRRGNLSLYRYAPRKRLRVIILTATFILPGTPPMNTIFKNRSRGTIPLSVLCRCSLSWLSCCLRLNPPGCRFCSFWSFRASLWINFSIPFFTGTGLFFMSYLVVSSIQMGANIDYAIVIASRYQELKGKMGS